MGSELCARVWFKNGTVWELSFRWILGALLSSGKIVGSVKSLYFDYTQVKGVFVFPKFDIRTYIN